MIVNNAYNPYQAVSATTSTPATATAKATTANAKPASTALDSVSLSAPAMEQYLKAQQAGVSGLNPIYKNLDIDKDYGGWASFKAKELFSAKPEAKDMLTVYIPPTLQEKMDADPFFAAEIKRRAESFLAEKTAKPAGLIADSYTQDKTISLTLSFDNNGEIGDRWTSTIWPELSAAAVESYPQQAAVEAQATAKAKSIVKEPVTPTVAVEPTPTPTPMPATTVEAL